MLLTSSCSRRLLVVLGLFAFGVGACRQEQPSTEQRTAPSASLPASAESVTRGDRIAAYADSILALERIAAGWAFADPAGESEGAEEREHTIYGTSLVLAARAVELDSSSAYAWLVMGDVLATRANRGFGVFDTLDLTRALAALERASELSAVGAPRAAQIQESLRETRSNLAVLRKR